MSYEFRTKFVRDSYILLPMRKHAQIKIGVRNPGATLPYVGLQRYPEVARTVFRLLQRYRFTSVTMIHLEDIGCLQREG